MAARYITNALRAHLQQESTRFIDGIRLALATRSPLSPFDLVDKYQAGPRSSGVTTHTHTLHHTGKRRISWTTLLQTALSASFAKKQHAELQASSKTALYARTLPTPWTRMAPYLQNGLRCAQCKALALVRLGGDPLMIERGRYLQRRVTVRQQDGTTLIRNLARESHIRICPLCAQAVENEAHFLCVCSAYNNLRALYIADAWANDTRRVSFCSICPLY